jgi:hypothetical protein
MSDMVSSAINVAEPLLYKENVSFFTATAEPWNAGRIVGRQTMRLQISLDWK